MSSDEQSRASRPLDGDSGPYISVAAPAYNEEEVIRKMVMYWSECLDRLELDGEIVLCNDGSTDGQFDLMEIKDFLAEIEKDGADGIVEYRVAKQDSLARVLADRCLNMIVRTLFGTRLRDTNYALKLVRRDLLQKLRLEATGFSFPTEVCVRLEEEGAELTEAPVHHLPRAAGESKLDAWRVGWQMLWFLIYMRLQRTLRRRKIARIPVS